MDQAGDRDSISPTPGPPGGGDGTPDWVVDVFDHLEALAQELVGAGFRVGLRQVVTARRLLLELAARDELPADPARLAGLLGPLFCHSPAEQDAFPALFTAWVTSLRPAPAPPPITPRRPFPIRVVGAITAWVASLRPAPAPPPISPKRPFPILEVGAIAAVNVAAAVGVWALWSSPADRSILRPAPPAATEILANGAPGPTGLSWPRAALLAGQVTLIVGLPVAVWRRRRRIEARRSAWQLRALPMSRPALKELVVQPEGRFAAARAPTPFEMPELETAARGLGRRVAIGPGGLDVAATVARSIRQAGAFQPVFAPRLASPDHLVLADRTGDGDHRARLADVLIDHLEGRGLAVRRYDFFGDPRVCIARDPGAAPWATPPASLQAATLADLTARASASERLLIVSDGAGLIGPLTGEPEPWLRVLEAWPERALVTPEPPSRWGYREWMLRREGLKIVPATPTGLAALAATVDPSLGPSPATAEGPAPPLPALLRRDPRRWVDGRDPGDRAAADLFRVLQGDLGADGFAWLGACAVYPTLQWELTLALGRVLKRPDGRPLFDEPTLRRLARLPWFIRGALPDWLRARLVASLPRALETQVRDYLKRLLDTAAAPSSPGGMRLPMALGEAPGTARRRPPDRIVAAVVAGIRPGPLGVPLPSEVADLLTGRPDQPPAADRLADLARRAKHVAWTVEGLTILALGIAGLSAFESRPYAPWMVVFTLGTIGTLLGWTVGARRTARSASVHMATSLAVMILSVIAYQNLVLQYPVLIQLAAAANLAFAAYQVMAPHRHSLDDQIDIDGRAWIAARWSAVALSGIAVVNALSLLENVQLVNLVFLAKDVDFDLFIIFGPVRLGAGLLLGVPIIVLGLVARNRWALTLGAIHLAFLLVMFVIAPAFEFALVTQNAAFLTYAILSLGLATPLIRRRPKDPVDLPARASAATLATVTIVSACALLGHAILSFEYATDHGFTGSPEDEWVGLSIWYLLGILAFWGSPIGLALAYVTRRAWSVGLSLLHVAGIAAVGAWVSFDVVSSHPGWLTLAASLYVAAALALTVLAWRERPDLILARDATEMGWTKRLAPLTRLADIAARGMTAADARLIGAWGTIAESDLARRLRALRIERSTAAIPIPTQEESEPMGFESERIPPRAGFFDRRLMAFAATLLAISFISLVGAYATGGEEWARMFNDLDRHPRPDATEVPTIGVACDGFLIECFRSLIIVGVGILWLPGLIYREQASRLIGFGPFRDPRAPRASLGVILSRGLFVVLGLALLLTVFSHHWWYGPRDLWASKGFRTGSVSRAVPNPAQGDYVPYWWGCVLPYRIYFLYAFINFCIIHNTMFTVCFYSVASELQDFYRRFEEARDDFTSPRRNKEEVERQFNKLKEQIGKMLDNHIAVLFFVVLAIWFLAWFDWYQLSPRAAILTLNALVFLLMPIIFLLVMSVALHEWVVAVAEEALPAKDRSAFRGKNDLWRFLWRAMSRSMYFKLVVFFALTGWPLWYLLVEKWEWL